jgi:hypothetical protein
MLPALAFRQARERSEASVGRIYLLLFALIEKEYDKFFERGSLGTRGGYEYLFRLYYD